MARQGLLKADRLHAGFDDVRPVSKSVDHGPAETRLLKHLRIPYSLIQSFLTLPSLIRRIPCSGRPCRLSGFSPPQRTKLLWSYNCPLASTVVCRVPLPIWPPPPIKPLPRLPPYPSRCVLSSR